LKLADGLKKIGEKHGATAGQVALAWVLAQGEDIIPLPGTTKIKVSQLIFLNYQFCTKQTPL
jgi:aryl-alcohol dehydrogenase-like predicted oxidoreductase